jgi:hypothetical protein
VASFHRNGWSNPAARLSLTFRHQTHESTNEEDRGVGDLPSVLRFLLGRQHTDDAYIRLDHMVIGVLPGSDDCPLDAAHRYTGVARIHHWLHTGLPYGVYDLGGVFGCVP